MASAGTETGWLEQYFIQPIMQNGWYNPLNTIVYALVLIAAVLGVYKMLQRMNIRVDRHFFYAILPFIFWGSTTRVLKDAGTAGALATPGLNEFYSAPIFVTPGSYIITFALALGSLIIALMLHRYAKIAYWKAMLTLGIVFSAANMAMMPLQFMLPAAIVISITLLWTALFFGSGRIFSSQWLSKKFSFTGKLFSAENSGILSAHFLDATATTVALSLFSYGEQHVVPRFFMPILGTEFAMFLLKIAVVLPVLWIIDRYAEEGEFKNFLKIVVLILGLAPGLRDMTRMVVGV